MANFFCKDRAVTRHFCHCSTALLTFFALLTENTRLKKSTLTKHVNEHHPIIPIQTFQSNGNSGMSLLFGHLALPPNQPTLKTLNTSLTDARSTTNYCIVASNKSGDDQRHRIIDTGSKLDENSSVCHLLSQKLVSRRVRTLNSFSFSTFLYWENSKL